MLLQLMLHTPERRLNFERGLVMHEMLKVFSYKTTEAVVFGYECRAALGH